MNLDTLNTAELFSEVAELAREQGTDSEEDWKLLVDEVMESHESLGEENDNQDLQTKKNRLYMMWAEYQLEAGEETLGAAGEDPDAPHA